MGEMLLPLVLMHAMAHPLLVIHHVHIVGPGAIQHVSLMNTSHMGQFKAYTWTNNGWAEPLPFHENTLRFTLTNDIVVDFQIERTSEQEETARVGNTTVTVLYSASMRSGSPTATPTSSPTTVNTSLRRMATVVLSTLFIGMCIYIQSNRPVSIPQGRMERAGLPVQVVQSTQWTAIDLS